MSNLAAQLRVLRHRDFRYLWLAQTASVIGDCIVIVALALFVIELTGSATDLGLVKPEDFDKYVRPEKMIGPG